MLGESIHFGTLLGDIFGTKNFGPVKCPVIFQVLWGFLVSRFAEFPGISRPKAPIERNTWNDILHDDFLRFASPSGGIRKKMKRHGKRWFKYALFTPSVQGRIRLKVSPKAKSIRLSQFLKHLPPKTLFLLTNSGAHVTLIRFTRT